MDFEGKRDLFPKIEAIGDGCGRQVLSKIARSCCLGSVCFTSVEIESPFPNVNRVRSPSKVCRAERAKKRVPISGLLDFSFFGIDYCTGAAAVESATTAVESTAGASSTTGVSSTTTVSSTTVSSVVLLPQEAVAIKPAIAKIANTFFICYGFLNYEAKVLVLFSILQGAAQIFFICFCKQFLPELLRNQSFHGCGFPSIWYRGL